jgi:S1-C subfamily serine protease/tetratricopeptide (TPR) repeat protein
LVLILLAFASFDAASANEPTADSAALRRSINASVYLEVERVFYGNTFWTTGSGFFVSPNGHILTNAHVVSDRFEMRRSHKTALVEANVIQIRAVLNPHTTRERVVLAKVVGIDENLDLALLKTGYHARGFVDSIVDADEVSVLQDLFVVGFPFGDMLSLDSSGAPSEQGAYPEVSVNRGHISAVRRNSSGQMVALQTDAEISPGNSGGPMLTPAGELVGVVYAEVSDSKQLGFAVSPNRVAAFLDRHRLSVTFAPRYLPQGPKPIAVNAAYGGLSAATPARGEVIVVSSSGREARFDLRKRKDKDEWTTVLQLPWDGGRAYRISVELRSANGTLLGSRKILYETFDEAKRKSSSRETYDVVVKNRRTPGDYARQKASEDAADKGLVIRTEKSTDFSASSGDGAMDQKEEKPGVDLSNLRDRAKALYRVGEYRTAAEIFAQILQEDPSDEIARDYLELSRGKLELQASQTETDETEASAVVALSIVTPEEQAQVRISVDGSEVQLVSVVGSRPDIREIPIPVGNRSLNIAFMIGGVEHGSDQFIREFSEGERWLVRLEHADRDDEPTINLVKTGLR